MTERWVSKKRYWCKHCKVWMADNPSTRKTHENGSQHKHNIREFLKTTFGKGKVEREEKRELQDELQAIEDAALKSFETDLRKRGVNDYRTAARQAAHHNPLSERGVSFRGRRRPGDEQLLQRGGGEGEEAEGAEGGGEGEVPEWKAAALEAKRQLELATQYFYVDASGKQQGPHPLASMRSWYTAGYLPKGTMVAKDGGDEWLDVTACPAITQEALGEVIRQEGAAAAAAATEDMTDVEQRQAALGMSSSTADVVQRRVAVRPPLHPPPPPATAAGPASLPQSRGARTRGC
eukprot:COSAG04_NODE_625_length_11793_cov_11.719942_8_plen_292_part_00